jgi:predicted nucleic acid-binding protein
MLREKAVRIARELLDSACVKVVAQSRETLLWAMERYANRADKRYSLTDCASMNVMDAEGIKDVLTHDHHFEQEGYNLLIRPPSGRK